MHHPTDRITPVVEHWLEREARYQSTKADYQLNNYYYCHDHLISLLVSVAVIVVLQAVGDAMYYYCHHHLISLLVRVAVIVVVQAVGDAMYYYCHHHLISLLVSVAVIVVLQAVGDAMYYYCHDHLISLLFSCDCCFTGCG